ncbi:MAG: prolipoprotein diacylglyceryl transferase, partial [Firmicutes bacterium]|nr:prolipoprotein diacylglyceryl transferase [Bacillota bacterium]
MSPGTDFLNLDFFPIYVIVILIGVIVSIILVPYFGKNRKEKKWLYILLGVLCIAAVTGIICAILAITGNPGFENTGIIIRWYAVCIILGFGLAIFVAAYLFKQKGLKPSLVFDFAIVLIPLCILGARTFYVAFDSNSSVNSFLGFLNI